ncbi:MAG: hypothetical protein FIA99_16060 [Ruminiclostridium sp.]|nr:hypothetical protein [Ruminiclostridium sp.]
MSIYGEHPLAARFAGLCKEASDWFFSFEGAAVPDIRKDLMCGWKPGTYYPSNFDSEGASWEGLNYMDEVLLNSIRFAESYRRQTGEEILPLETMKKVAEFILNGSFRQGDRMRAVNFGDSRAGAATIPGVTAYLARRLKHPGMQWFLHNCQNNFNENAIFKYETIPVFDFLWYDPDISPCEPEKVQTMKIYPGMGCAVMRNGWGHESSMLAFRCGSTGGHAHPDAGSFVLYSRDKMLLIDSGCCGYEMPEQSEYYQTTRAHNTILVGDEGQIKRLDGKLVDEISQPELSFVLGDAAAPYEGRLSQFLRGVLFVGREYYVIIDWLNKQTDKPYQWLLHYDGEMIRKTKGYFIKNERANLLVKIIEPSEYNMKIRQGYKTYNEDLTTSKSTEEKQKELESGDYMEITPVHNMNQQKFLTILYPFGKNGNAPKIEKMEAENWVGIRVDRNHEVDIIGLNMDVMKDGGGLTGIKADAELFCITFNKYGIPIRAFMKTGTYLKYEGNLLASSPEPATIAVEV